MIYGYARVSTKGQAQNGNSLEDQQEKLKASGAEAIYSDSFTGTQTDRPELDKLKKALKSGDTVIVTKLDRLARSAGKGAELVSEWLKSGVKINILNMGIIDDTPTGRLIMNIMFSFAEFERDMIVERTQEGKAIAKSKPGYRDGRPQKYTQAQLDHAIELLGNNSYTKVEEMTGISRSTLLRERQKRGLTGIRE